MSALAWWIFQDAVTVSLFVPVVWLLARLRGTYPAEQHLLWLLLLVKLLTPPLVCWPWSVDDLREQCKTALPTVVISHRASEGSRDAPGDGWSLAGASAVAGGEAEARAATSGEVRVLPSVPSETVQVVDKLALSGTLYMLPRAAALGWLLGAAVVGLRLGVRLRRQWRVLADTRVPSPALQRRCDEMTRRMRIHPVPVRVSVAILNPFVSCLGRPIVVWPGSLAEPEVFAQNEGVFAHELAHVRRRDHWVAWLELAGVLVWWWNPVFWYICRKLEETRELACDALALELSSADPQDFATALLGMSASQHWVQAPLTPLSQGIGARSSFQRRLKMLFDERASGRLSSVGLALAGLLAFVGLPGWAWGQNEPAAPRVQRSLSQPAAAAPATAAEASYYVAVDGRRENDGSLAKPWPTVEFALSKVGPGNTIIVRSGIYRGPIDLRDLPGATVDRPTVVKAEVKWKAVINGAQSDAINVVNCPGVVIDGFEVLGARASGVSMNTDYGTVRDCWVHNNTHMGIASHNHRGVRIEANLVEFNGCNIQFHHGVYADGENLTVCHNIVRHNSGFGLHLYPSIKDSMVSQNLVHGHSRQPGIIVACPEGGGRNRIVHNTVVGNACAIAIWRGDGERVFNNILLSAGEVLSCANGTKNVSADYNLCGPDLAHQGAHSASADPRFVDPDRGVFWLRPESPAIGKGTSEHAPATDFWGRPWPRGKAPDVGAFAFVPSLAEKNARVGWHGWPYRFADKGEMELSDPWELPEEAK